MAICRRYTPFSERPMAVHTKPMAYLPICSMGISGSNTWSYVSTIFLAIFWGDIPWNLGLNNRPYRWNRYLQSIGSWVMALDNISHYYWLNPIISIIKSHAMIISHDDTYHQIVCYIPLLVDGSSPLTAPTYPQRRCLRCASTIVAPASSAWKTQPAATLLF